MAKAGGVALRSALLKAGQQGHRSEVAAQEADGGWLILFGRRVARMRGYPKEKLVDMWRSKQAQGQAGRGGKRDLFMRCWRAHQKGRAAARRWVKTARRSERGAAGATAVAPAW